MLRAVLISTVIIIVAVLAALVIQDPHIDIRIKLLQQAMRLPFWMCGMHGDGSKFNRECMKWLGGRNLVPPTGQNISDGIKSRDILIPFALEAQTGWNEKVRARLFEPVLNPACNTEQLPLIFYLHGGGFVLGSVDMMQYDELCRILARKARAFVLSIDYRLAPEHPFPNGIYDVYSAYSWVDQNLAKTNKQDFFARVDPNKIVVAGDSAGGSLSVVTTLVARDGIKHSADSKSLPRATFQPKYQVLIYPAIDRDAQTRDMPGSYILSKENMQFFTASYVKDESIFDRNHHQHHLFKHAGANLAGLPEALVITAKYDPLAGEGKAYAEELKKAGVAVTFKEYDSVHGFLTFFFLKESEESIDFMVQKMLQKIGNLTC